jgi:hypothetical protein
MKRIHWINRCKHILKYYIYATNLNWIIQQLCIQLAINVFTQCTLIPACELTLTYLIKKVDWIRRNLHLQRRKGSTTKSLVSNCNKWKQRHENDLMSARHCILFFILYPAQRPPNSRGPIPLPTCRGPI